jgi:hypothetical protein
MSNAAPASAPPAEVRHNGAPRQGTSAVQPVLGPWIRAQALNLARHTAALRNFTREDFGTGPEAPTDGHVQAVNQLLGQLRPGLKRRALQSISLFFSA